MRAVLKSANINQYDAAKMLNVSQPCINLWLSGKREPNQEDVKKFCETFGTTPNFLYGFSDVNVSEADIKLLQAVKTIAARPTNAAEVKDNAIQAESVASTGKER